MQTYIGIKEAEQKLVEQPKTEKQDKRLEDNLGTKEKEQDDISKITKGNKKPNKIQEDLKVIKQENGFTAYFDNKSLSFTQNWSEELYAGNEGNKDYYSRLMGGEKEDMQLRAQLQDIKTQKEAETAQYVARESLIMGAGFSVNGAPSRDEQTSLSAYSTRMDSQWMEKNTHPGWWQVLYDAKCVVPSEFV